MLTSRFPPDFFTKPWRAAIDKDDQIPVFLERLRWPRGIKCPYCGSSKVTRFQKPKRKPEGRYLYHCRAQRHQFTVTTGTALDRTHVPMEKWLQAIALIPREGSRRLKEKELMQRLGVTHKTAEKMCRRLRRGMRTSFIRNLYAALRMYRTPQAIFCNIFPDLYE